MRISLSPQRRDDKLSISKFGDILTVNSEQFDFSNLPDGATISADDIPCEWIIGKVERIDGELHISLLLPHGSNPEQWQAFPEPINVVEDGEIIVPFDSYSEQNIEPVEDGINFTVTTYRWNQEPEIEIKFIPNEVNTNVDA